MEDVFSLPLAKARSRLCYRTICLKLCHILDRAVTSFSWFHFFPCQTQELIFFAGSCCGNLVEAPAGKPHEIVGLLAAGYFSTWSISISAVYTALPRTGQVSLRFLSPSRFSLWFLHKCSGCMRLCWVASFVSASMDCSPSRLLCPWDCPGKKTGVGGHALFQGIFHTQRLKPRLLHLLHWQVGS